MKAILLVNGYIAHKLGNVPNESKKAQRKRPTKVSEVFSEESFQAFDAGNLKSWFTSYQTVNFSWLLNPSYQEIISLPEDILTIITHLNNERTAP